MKHIVVNEYGTFLGIKSARLVLYQDDQIIKELPLNRLASVSIIKEGVSFSSNLLLDCAMRGIKFFVFDSYGREVVCLNGGHQHAVSQIREKQFEFVKSLAARDLAKTIIIAKIKNQRAVLQYYRKYLGKSEDPFIINFLPQIDTAIRRMHGVVTEVNSLDFSQYEKWRPMLLGFEGVAANIYFSTLVNSKFFPTDFKGRTGRGASDVVNQMLNYGYGVLSTYIWQCAINCGLEIYAGFLHVQRAGKPSLILDLMEEYRPWIVDRVVIKMRDQISNHGTFTKKLRHNLVLEIQKQMAKKFA